MLQLIPDILRFTASFNAKIQRGNAPVATLPSSMRIHIIPCNHLLETFFIISTEKLFAKLLTF